MLSGIGCRSESFSRVYRQLSHLSGEVIHEVSGYIRQRDDWKTQQDAVFTLWSTAHWWSAQNLFIRNGYNGYANNTCFLVQQN